jgi:hypothetical protein
MGTRSEERWKNIERNRSFWKAEIAREAWLLGNPYKSENVERRRKSLKFLGFHGSECSDGGLLGCDTM